MMHPLDLLLFTVCAATCARLLFYRRAGARFKRHISLLAYLLIVLTGSIALSLATGKITSDDLPSIAIIALIALCAVIFYTHGNIAQVLRLTRRLP